MENLSEFLSQYNGFGECIIREVRLRDYQTTVELVIDYVWDAGGKRIRRNLDQQELIMLRFERVQEIRVQNHSNEAQLAEPEQMNWGMNEVSLIRVNDDPAVLSRYRGLPTVFHQVEVRWENERSINIVFADFEFVPIPKSPATDADRQQVNEAALALLYLWSWQEYGTHRVWKGIDWDVLDYLYEQGWISDPKSKAKSITLTDEGVAKAQEFVAKHFPPAK